MESGGSEGASGSGLQHHLKTEKDLCSLKLGRICGMNCCLRTLNLSGLRSWYHFNSCPTEWMVPSYGGTVSLGSSSRFSDLLQTCWT